MRGLLADLIGLPGFHYIASVIYALAAFGAWASGQRGLMEFCVFAATICAVTGLSLDHERDDWRENDHP